MRDGDCRGTDGRFNDKTHPSQDTNSCGAPQCRGGVEPADMARSARVNAADTREMNTLIVGKAISGFSAFVQPSHSITDEISAPSDANFCALLLQTKNVAPEMAA